ncbi:hypothetical protein [Streptomyces sp. YS-3]
MFRRRVIWRNKYAAERLRRVVPGVNDAWQHWRACLADEAGL